MVVILSILLIKSNIIQFYVLLWLQFYAKAFKNLSVWPLVKAQIQPLATDGRNLLREVSGVVVYW
jgi:hypothetical protein